MSDSTQEEAHTGPIKTPKQLLLAVFFSFVIPVFAIIALVAFVVAENKPSGAAQIENYSLGGLSPKDLDKGVAERIGKVGTVEIRDANSPLKGGQDVFKAQCSACHGAGLLGAPKFGDAAAWGPRIAKGFDALVNSALHGKNSMPAQGGGDFQDIEVARAVAYMADAAGAKFPEPKQPAGGAQAATTAPVAATVSTAAPAAAAPALAAAPQQAAAAGAGEALYTQTCFACHGTGAAGAPKFGDKAAWAPRIAKGIPTLVQHATQGFNTMPAKGGSSAPDAQVRAAVEYMVNAAK